MKFNELPDVCNYNTFLEDFAKSSLKVEKKACGVVREVLGIMIEKIAYGVVREVLGMMVEKRTLIVRKEFGLPNKLRAMIVEKRACGVVREVLGMMVEKRTLIVRKEVGLPNKLRAMIVRHPELMIIRERRKASINGPSDCVNNDNDEDVDYDDGFENLFDSEDLGLDSKFHDDDNESIELYANGGNDEF
ncbi:hypothetical protein REPUB_Repub20aG0046600 [Reevesia pubescens]